MPLGRLRISLIGLICRWLTWRCGSRLSRCSIGSRRTDSASLSRPWHNWSSARRTNLLSFEPTSKTCKMQNVAAREFLRPHPLRYRVGRRLRCRIISSVCWWEGPHLLPTNDASVLPSDLVRCCIRVPFVHISRSCPVFDKVRNAFEERSAGKENVAHNVDRKAVEYQENEKER